MKLEHIYIDGNDKYVGNYRVYGKSADSKLYVDAALTEQVSQADLQEAFLKGLLLIQVGNDVFRPVKVAANKAVVIDVVSGTATAKEFAAKAE